MTILFNLFIAFVLWDIYFLSYIEDWNQVLRGVYFIAIIICLIIDFFAYQQVREHYEYYIKRTRTNK